METITFTDKRIGRIIIDKVLTLEELQDNLTKLKNIYPDRQVKIEHRFEKIDNLNSPGDNYNVLVFYVAQTEEDILLENIKHHKAKLKEFEKQLSKLEKEKGIQ